MSEYDQTFDPNILIGHCDHISRFIDFCLISLLSISIFSYIFQIMSEYGQTLDPNIHIGLCDLISALYLGTQLVNEQTYFTLCLHMTMPLTLKYS